MLLAVLHTGRPLMNFALRRAPSTTMVPALCRDFRPTGICAAEVADASIAELEAQIAAQGERVRAVKEKKKAGDADKAAVDAEVAILLDLKAKLPEEEPERRLPRSQPGRRWTR